MILHFITNATFRVEEAETKQWGPPLKCVAALGKISPVALQDLKLYVKRFPLHWITL